MRVIPSDDDVVEARAVEVPEQFRQGLSVEPDLRRRALQISRYDVPDGRVHTTLPGTDIPQHEPHHLEPPGSLLGRVRPHHGLGVAGYVQGEMACRGQDLIGGYPGALGEPVVRAERVLRRRRARLGPAPG